MVTKHQSEKLSISLPGEMARWIREKVEAGVYSSNSEIVREGLRLLQDQEEIRKKKLRALQDMVDVSLKTGSAISADKAFVSLERRNRR